MFKVSSGGIRAALKTLRRGCEIEVKRHHRKIEGQSKLKPCFCLSNVTNKECFVPKKNSEENNNIENRILTESMKFEMGVPPIELITHTTFPLIQNPKTTIMIAQIPHAISLFLIGERISGFACKKKVTLLKRMSSSSEIYFPCLDSSQRIVCWICTFRF